MDKYEETFDTWNNIASLYQEKFMDLKWYDESYDYICTAVAKQNAKLLEIGCGPGNITKYLLSQRPDFDIFGIDIAPNMIELAKSNNPKANFAVMDSRKIGDLDTKYDGIICGFCLPYVSPAEGNELLSNSYRLLNENGLLYLSFVAGNPEESEYKVGSGGRIYFQFHQLNTLKSQLVKLGFYEIKTFEVRYPISETEFETHTILTAKK